MQQKEISELKDRLSLEYDIDIQYITPIKNVIKITTEDGDKCLKRIKYEKGHFLFILSAMKHLMNNGFEGIIPFIPRKNGELYIDLKDGFGFLTDWVNSRECNYSNPIDLKIAAAALSNLHKASENFKPMEGAKPWIGWGSWIENFKRRIDEMLVFRNIIDNKNSLTDFDKLYRDKFDYYLKQGISAIEHLKDTKYLELSGEESKKSSFCHHDYANHNVLMGYDFKVYIIDFDYCICDTRIHDLSSLIIRNMRHGNWNMEKAQYIMDCYLKKGHIIKDEIPVMSAFMEFPQDFWQVGLQYYIEKQKWEDANFNKRLNNVINDMIDRGYFLDEFKSSIEV